MTQKNGKELALAMLAEFEAGASRVDIGAAHGVGESAVYFTLRFARFLRYRDQHPDNRADIGAWHVFDKAWSRTDKTAPEPTRFDELIAALPLATDAPAAKRKNAKTPPAEAHWPPATEAAAIIEAKTTPEPEPETPAPTPIADPELDTIATKRAAKTAAQRIRRALAKGRVQWRGERDDRSGGAVNRPAQAMAQGAKPGASKTRGK